MSGAGGSSRGAVNSVGAPPRGARGQASVETVAAIPLVAAVLVLLLQLLAAGADRELAGHAAEAGAVALIEGGDPEAAARDALPGWSRSGLAVSVTGQTVRVRLRPPLPVPGLAGALEAKSEASAAP
jgi:hypothetical protein